jgi:hypothetical protein
VTATAQVIHRHDQNFLQPVESFILKVLNSSPPLGG